MPKTQAALTESAWRRLAGTWNTFWFAPRDPTLLGFIRICCGGVALYALLMYSFELDNFLGPNAWVDRQSILEKIQNRPMLVSSLSGRPLNEPRAPATPEEERYGEDYRAKFGEWPLPPYPKSTREANYCERFRNMFSFDLRVFGLPPPENEKQWQDVLVYAERWKQPMPPPYPQDDAEADAIDGYLRRFQTDPRFLYARGTPTFSVWLHVTDPVWMRVTHGLFMAVTLLFTLGFATRVTAFLTWFAVLKV